MKTKDKALEIIESIKKATTYKYQVYAGVNYSIFEHDMEELKKVALIMVDEIIAVIENGNPIESQWLFWRGVKLDIEALK